MHLFDVFISQATLRGPFTPLEMEFSSLCRSAHMKPVQIERSSVNSVTLDQEPYSATARLLVAGTVAISDRTGAIMARYEGIGVGGVLLI